ncbi:hypothetical protein J2S13_002068 [Oikeobacillus pervagus]|uniref:UPF0738 protein J2S13_002068 n=1 Tax=Oikeobacillus pervagus TaxID=1325931 RepID=A0AAJ1SZB9_9BACI|nr:hypothetical protein [Oikeobacillus pervagus]MDQ0215650.1 hypothetical protein [Oikeobacillus pervagus]
MRKKLHIKQSFFEKGNLYLLSEEVHFQNIEACGRMIVDSDEFAFVYLLEEDNEFIYLYIHENTWKDLEQAMNNGGAIIVKGKEDEIILEGIQEELSYLIENIEGNSNYGEEMVKKVEDIFLHTK